MYERGPRSATTGGGAGHETPGRRRGQPRLPAWVVPAAILAVLGLATLAIGSLNDYARRSGDVQVRLAYLGEEAGEQVVLAHNVLSDGEMGPEAVEENRENRDEVVEAFDELEGLDPGGEAIARVRRSYRAFDGAVEEELRLAAAGRSEEARAVLERRVDPSYEAQHDELNAAHEEYGEIARRGNLAADAGTVGMALFAVVVIGLLFRRHEGARRAEGARRTEQEALRYSEERFRSLVQDGADLILILDAAGDVRYASSSVGTVLGYEARGVIGGDVLHLLAPVEAPKFRKLLDAIVEEPGVKVTTELRARHADGRGLLLEATCSNMLENPSIGGIVVNARDVSERKRAVESLRRSQTRLSEAQRMARLGNWEWNVVTGEAWWSEEVFRIYGYDPDEFVPTFERFMSVVHPDDRERLGRAIYEALRHGEEYALDHRVVLPDGTVRFVRRQARVDRDERDEPLRMVGTVQDITERKKLEEKLEHQALHDGLTDLPNRALFMDRLGHALKHSVGEGGPVAVLFLDLDNFKYVNDSLGHETGDALLVEVAGRLRGCVRSVDTVARFGGDEFTVLLEDAGSGAPEGVAESIAEELDAPFALGGHEVFVGASVGIALAGSPDDRPADLIRRADLAMYAAKRNGKAKYEVFDPSMAAAHSRLKLENDLRRALGDQGQEFEVYYQPKVLLANGALAGFETLVRWKHPERGLVSPVEFIPVAEETGLILPIGHWVLEESCLRTKAWQDRQGREIGAQPLTVSVNLSARQFQGQNLPQQVDRVLDRSGLPPGSLELEITESVIMDNSPPTAKTLRDPKALGVRLSIDDFGTGYSSLSYLKHLPVDCLKIDRSFVWGLGQDVEGTAIVSAIVNLARDLGIEVVAEGVESAPQLDPLRALGCGVAQGFYSSEPVDHSNASLLLDAASPPRAGR